jgi:hypothetical protein
MRIKERDLGFKPDSLICYNGFHARDKLYNLTQSKYKKRINRLSLRY